MKYCVFIQEIHSVCVEIEAENKEDARIKAVDIMESDELIVEYSETVDSYSWPIIKSNAKDKSE